MSVQSARWIINRRDEADGRQDANAGHRHQPSARIAVFGEPEKVLLQRSDFLLNACADSQQR